MHFLEQSDDSRRGRLGSKLVIFGVLQWSFNKEHSVERNFGEQNFEKPIECSKSIVSIIKHLNASRLMVFTVV